MLARMQRMDDEAGQDDGDIGQEDGLLLDLDDDDFESFWREQRLQRW